MQSLMIDDYGVTELSLSEMKDIDGGIILLTICSIIGSFIEGIIKGAMY